MNKRPSDASMAIEMLREHSLATLAQQELERRIISGEIAAGAKLNEVEVAAALGVSRGPVREAFSALSQAGLVRVEKNRGVFVRDVVAEEGAEHAQEVEGILDDCISACRDLGLSLEDIQQHMTRRILQLQKAQAGGESCGEGARIVRVDVHQDVANAQTGA